MKSSFLNRHQALSLWSGSSDSKTLDYQRNKHKQYQIVRTDTKETTWIQDLASPIISSTLCRTPHWNNKQSKNTNAIISRPGLPPYSAIPIRVIFFLKKANKHLGKYQMHQLSNYKGPRGEERKKRGVWENFWRNYSGIFLQHGKENSQSRPRGTKCPKQDNPKEKHAKTHTNQTNKD